MCLPKNETFRIYKAISAGNESRAEGALCRFQELYCKAYLGRNLEELAVFNRYLDHFAFRSRSCWHISTQ